MKTHTSAKPMMLIILDGFGERAERKHNAIRLARTPTFDNLFAHFPHIFLEASGEAVGLPHGQMGNSEVGHLHIGSGRKVPQDLTRIDNAIKTGEFFENPLLTSVLKSVKKEDSALHIIGLLSQGGVHSHEHQISALIQMAHQQGIPKNYLHAILDGRDTPPKSAMQSLQKIDAQYKKYGTGQIASLIGRYYAMDRDKRWERTQKAYDLLTRGTCEYCATTAEEGLQIAYSHGETDEFVKPISIHEPNQNSILVKDGDTIIFMNFRPDRARQLTRAFTDTHFEGFERTALPKLADFVTLTQYATDISAHVAFEPLKLSNTLGEYFSALGLHQLRVAETEKYAHVTYFLNGGIEAPFHGEDRILIPSPKVSTYDLKPEMSAKEMTDKVVSAIENGKYDFIACNFANPDMVGHTGNEAATIKAISFTDQCIHRILDALAKVGGEALITADHGNAELMYDEKTGQPHTAHTTNRVPLIYVGRPAEYIAESGSLDDVAPTLLYLMGLTPPNEMTGHNLIKLD